MKACIEATLELLTKSLSDKIKTLVLCTGIGTSLQIAVLNNLWNISKQEAEEAIDILWGYGLVIFDTISPNCITQRCVEVHAVISQYIIDCIDSNEVFALSPVGGTFNTILLVGEGLSLTLEQSYGPGVNDPSSLTVVDYLKFRIRELEDMMLPYQLKGFNVLSIMDPHLIIQSLHAIKTYLNLSCTKHLLPLFGEEINILQNKCKEICDRARENRSCRRIQCYEKNQFEVLKLLWFCSAGL